MLLMSFLPFLAVIMRGHRTVRAQSENGQSILWPFSQPGPLGKFEENHEENLEEEFEKPYFEENLKLNRRYQINFEKDDNDHNDDNRPPPESPPPNSKSTRQIINKNIVEFRDQLTIRKDNYAYFVT